MVDHVSWRPLVILTERRHARHTSPIQEPTPFARAGYQQPVLDCPRSCAGVGFRSGTPGDREIGFWIVVFVAVFAMLALIEVMRWQRLNIPRIEKLDMIQVMTIPTGPAGAPMVVAYNECTSTGEPNLLGNVSRCVWNRKEVTIPKTIDCPPYLDCHLILGTYPARRTNAYLLSHRRTLA